MTDAPSATPVLSIKLSEEPETDTDDNVAATSSTSTLNVACAGVVALSAASNITSNAAPSIVADTGAAAVALVTVCGSNDITGLAGSD